MWLWLWAVLIFTISEPRGGFAANSTISATSVGPTSAEEAEVLWREGKQSYEAGAYRDALSDLQRLIDRYPGFAGFREAHLLVGRAQLKLGEAARALGPIQFYIAGGSDGPDLYRAKISLARAYLGTRHFHEAELLSEELERKFTAAKVADPDLRAENMLLKSQALLGLHHDDRARMALDSAKGYLATSISPSLKAEGSWTEIVIHNRACARLPGRGTMEEDQFVSQVVRRGSCLQESLLAYWPALESGDLEFSRKGEQELEIAFRDYLSACVKAPHPPKATHPDLKTATELKRYRKELAFHAQQECLKKVHDAAVLTSTWNGKTAQSLAPVQEDLGRFLESLR